MKKNASYWIAWSLLACMLVLFAGQERYRSWFMVPAVLLILSASGRVVRPPWTLAVDLVWFAILGLPWWLMMQEDLERSFKPRLPLDTAVMRCSLASFTIAAIACIPRVRLRMPKRGIQLALERTAPAFWIAGILSVWIYFFVVDLRHARFQLVLWLVPAAVVSMFVLDVTVALFRGVARPPLVQSIASGMILSIAPLWLAFALRAENECMGVSQAYETTMACTMIGIFLLGADMNSWYRATAFGRPA